MANTSVTEKNTTERLVDKIAREKRKRRLLSLVLLILMGAMLLTFLLALFIDKTGNFTITLNYSDKDLGFSLYDNKEFLNPTERLQPEKLKDMDNITFTDLPSLDELDGKDGSHHGVNKIISSYNTYFAYTFYIKNNHPTLNQGYRMSLNMDDSAKNADSAVRVMLITDKQYYTGQMTDRQAFVYAKSRTDGTPEVSGWYDKSFESDSVIVSQTHTDFPPQSTHKYTIIFYLEGNDPDCVSDIMGGFVKMSLNFADLAYEQEGNV